MKIRNGFVSNSSSSSFVLYLPKTFNLDKLLENYVVDGEYAEEILEEYEYNGDDEDVFVKEKLKEKIENFISDGQINEYDNYAIFNIAQEIFSPYVIADIDVSSDSGSIVIVDKNKIDEIEKLNS